MNNGKFSALIFTDIYDLSVRSIGLRVDKRGPLLDLLGWISSFKSNKYVDAWTELRQYGNSHDNVLFSSSDSGACTSLFTYGVLFLATETAGFLLHKLYGESFLLKAFFTDFLNENKTELICTHGT